MSRIIKFIWIASMVMGYTCMSTAQQSGMEDSYQDICSLSHGHWVGVSQPKWACCWVNWGCYECLNDACKMNCKTPQCKKANKMNVPGMGEKRLKSLAPAGMLAPIIPKHPKKIKLPLLPVLGEEPTSNSQ